MTRAMLRRTAPPNDIRPEWAHGLCHLLLSVVLVSLTSSCATKALWKATDPAEYIAVPQSEVSEAELQQRGVDYRKDAEHGLYYVEKTSLRRLGDYSIRFFAVPVTVVVDTATAIVGGGAVVSALVLNDSAARLERESRARAAMGRPWP